MSATSRVLWKTPVYIPLWKRAIPKYPLYWKGDPQRRVFMPLFWMRPVKSKEELPSNIVQFEVHPQMTKFDVKNYLEKIYKIPVQHVHTALFKGEEVKHPSKGFVLRHEPDMRMAFIQLADGSFEWPELFGKKKSEFEDLGEEFKKLKRKAGRNYQKQWSQHDVPGWFR